MKNLLWIILFVGIVGTGIFFLKKWSDNRNAFLGKEDSPPIFEITDRATADKFAASLFGDIRFNRTSAIHSKLNDLTIADSKAVVLIIRAWMANSQVKQAGYQSLVGTLRKLQCSLVDCELVEAAISNVSYQWDMRESIEVRPPTPSTRVRTYPQPNPTDDFLDLNFGDTGLKNRRN